MAPSLYHLVHFLFFSTTIFLTFLVLGSIETPIVGIKDKQFNHWPPPQTLYWIVNKKFSKNDTDYDKT